MRKVTTRYVCTLVISAGLVSIGIVGLRTNAVTVQQDSDTGGASHPAPARSSRQEQGPTDEAKGHTEGEEETIADDLCGTCIIVPSTYVNPRFGYRVNVPVGLRGIRPAPPMPDHGILVRLSNDPSCRMDVSGEFDSGLDPSLNAYAKRLMDDDKRKQGFTLLTRVDAALGSLPAVRFVVRYMDTASHGPVVVERLLAKRDLDDPPDLSIIYGFYLETPEDRYAEMAPIFQQFLQSWKQTKVSD